MTMKSDANFFSKRRPHLLSSAMEELRGIKTTKRQCSSCNALMSCNILEHETVDAKTYIDPCNKGTR